MPRDDWEETTQVRMIRAEAKIAASEEGVGILKAVSRMADDIKEEMHKHFATKADLADWKLDMYQEQDGKARQLIREHVSHDHKPSISPGGRISMIPKTRFTKSQKNWFWGGLLAALSAAGYALKAYFSS